MSAEVTVSREAQLASRENRHHKRPAWFWPVVVVGSLLVVATVRVLTGANDINSSGALAAALALAMPLALAGLGGLWSERAGVVNIGLEGMMILGTWGAAFFTYYYGPWVGILGAAAMGMVGGAIHAVATVVFGVDHIVSGVAMNLLGAGAGAYLAARTFSGLPNGGPTQSPPLAQLPFLSVPGVGDPLLALEQSHTWLVADLAGILRALTTNVNVLTLIAVALLVITWWVLWRTPFGLRVRACGEAPQAAETLGVNVLRLKFLSVLVSGGLAGLAGGFLVLVASNIYRDGQTGGRGYIGLAAMIFGNWRPGGLAAGALLFGYTDAIQLRGGGDVIRAYLLPIGLLLVVWGIWQLVRWRQGKGIAGLVQVIVGALALTWFAVIDAVPSEFTGMTPYLATLLVLAFASQRLRMPAADGNVYRKGEAS
ncbi:MAG: ABC transporter permease [Propionicimonas sp.]|uniref:ABC transporter permease n=1 Tax=Propionicimonas sp. TaxID=1955623 RepID=UPI002B1FE042|nr:ABC transporter permease [Propionicimonas sp.]MEA4944225.1 ABC transporter permease [Propionicimonas sp.]